MATLIQIQDDLWEELNKLKKRGETFDDVIRKNLFMNPEAFDNQQNTNIEVDHS